MSRKKWTRIVEALRGFRTLAVAAAIIILGALEAVDWYYVLPPEHQGLTMIGIGLLMAYLRYLTTRPLAWRADDSADSEE